MQATKLELTLEGGKKVICTKAGRGPRIAYIVGPGSFYLKGLAALQDEFTFFTSDEAWTYRKPRGDFFSQKKIQDMSIEGIRRQDHLIVEALKKQWDTDKVYGFGFSAPGALLFEQALHYPGDYCQLICTGIGVIPLDPKFESTDKIFYDKASPERIESFKQSQSEYKSLQTSLADPSSPRIDPVLLKKFDYKADGKAQKKFREKPHKDFVAGALAIQAKLLFNFKPVVSEEGKDIIRNHWKHNLFKDHVDGRVQKFFFEKLYSQLNPAVAIKKLGEKGTPVLLIYGDTDYVTPLPEDTAKDLAKYPSIALKIIPEAGHITYMEKPKEYAQIINKFMKKQSAAEVQPMILSKL